MAFVIFPLKQKASKKQKTYNLMTENLLSNSTTSLFKFIMTLTRGKIGGLCRINEQLLYLQENQEL